MAVTDDYASQPLHIRATTLAGLREAGHGWKEIADMLGTSESVVYRDNRRANLNRDLTKSANRRALIVRNAERGVCYGSGMRAFTSIPHEDPLAAVRAMQLCQECPIRDICATIVEPDNFDGICGGEAYYNGKIVTDDIRKMARRRVRRVMDDTGQYKEVSTRVTCWCGGTRYGRNRHLARGEKACPWSARSHSQYEAQRKRHAREDTSQPMDWGRIRTALKGGTVTMTRKEKVTVVVVLSLLGLPAHVVGRHAGIATDTVRKYRRLYASGELDFSEAEETGLAEMVQEFTEVFQPGR